MMSHSETPSKDPESDNLIDANDTPEAKFGRLKSKRLALFWHRLILGIFAFLEGNDAIQLANIYPSSFHRTGSDCCFEFSELLSVGEAAFGSSDAILLSRTS